MATFISRPSLANKSKIVLQLLNSRDREHSNNGKTLQVKISLRPFWGASVHSGEQGQDTRMLPGMLLLFQDVAALENANLPWWTSYFLSRTADGRPLQENPQFIHRPSFVSSKLKDHKCLLGNGQLQKEVGAA